MSAVGVFGHARRFEHHSGVDLYCAADQPVHAIEAGRVVAIEWFTGPRSTPTSPWWNETQAVLIEALTGDHVLVYGEIEALVRVGDIIAAGAVVGWVSVPVLMNFKGRPTRMLHMEMLAPGQHASLVWPLGTERPANLWDPTPLLLAARGDAPAQVFDLATYDGVSFR